MKFYNSRKPLLAILIFILCAGNSFAQKAVVSTEDEIKSDINSVSCKSEERFESVKKLFVKMGAKEEDFSVEEFKNGKNLIVEKKGKSDETIIIGAHYDKIDKGCGAIDNWTGIVIIANLYRTLAPLATNKTLKFVAFDKEESGLFGSRAMVADIPKEKYPQICSMINIDSFGFAAPQSPKNMANLKMIKLAKDTADEMKISFGDSAIENADADSSSFLSKKIPAITFDGLSTDWEKYLHTPNDKVENINPTSVFIGYRFILTFAAKADALDCGAFK